MPVKQRIRHSAKPPQNERGLTKGKAPHRKSNAHKVTRKWPYFRAIILWCLCLCILLLSLLVIGYGIFIKEKQFIIYGLALVIVWLVFRMFYYLSCRATICPLCRTSHLVNGKSNKHIKAYKVFPFSYATTAVFTAVFKGCIRCMHCGVTFDLHKKYRS